MRFSLVSVLLTATCVLAAPAPRPWCMRPSQPCWKAKRAVAALADAVTLHTPFLSARHDDDSHASSSPPGTEALNLYAAAAFEQLASHAAEMHDTPADLYGQLGVADMHTRDTDSALDTRRLWCATPPGLPDCFEHDIPEPEPDDGKSGISAADDSGHGHGLKFIYPYPDGKDTPTVHAEQWCKTGGVLGCWKRAVDSSEEALRWCGRPSEPCSKAMRAAEAILKVARDDVDTAEEGSCEEGSECWRAKRDLESLHAIARAVVETF